MRWFRRTSGSGRVCGTSTSRVAPNPFTPPGGRCSGASNRRCPRTASGVIIALTRAPRTACQRGTPHERAPPLGRMPASPARYPDVVSFAGRHQNDPPRPHPTSPPSFGSRRVQSVHDLIALRVVLEPWHASTSTADEASESSLCYHVLGKVHGCWTPMPQTLKDVTAAALEPIQRITPTPELPDHHPTHLARPRAISYDLSISPTISQDLPRPHAISRARETARVGRLPCSR